MQLEDLKGKLVLFKFSEEIRPDLPLFQIYKDELWAIVTGIDDVGIWIENPAYELGVWWDEKGNLIPQDKQIKEKVIKNDIKYAIMILLAILIICFLLFLCRKPRTRRLRLRILHMHRFYYKRRVNNRNYRAVEPAHSAVRLLIIVPLGGRRLGERQ